MVIHIHEAAPAKCQCGKAVAVRDNPGPPLDDTVCVPKPPATGNYCLPSVNGQIADPPVWVAS